MSIASCRRMLLPQCVPDPAGRGPWDAPLAPLPTTFARARSGILRRMAGLALPQSVLLSRGDRGRGRKRVALTFDDGPDAMSEPYLDLLARLGVRATFFLVGENAARMPGIVAEYVRRGHELGGHGWSHTPFSSLCANDLDEELARTHAALGAAVGRRRLVRPPQGVLSGGALLRIAASGYTTVLWSMDSDDCRTRDPRTISRRLAPAALGDGDIALLHEQQPWTLRALPDVIGKLREAGFQMVTISELMG